MSVVKQAQYMSSEINVKTLLQMVKQEMSNNPCLCQTDAHLLGFIC
jgi:hypothetical protein